jgi:fido (protein-threonine AMPylation protein)
MRNRAQLINSLELYRQNQLSNPQMSPLNERLVTAWIFHDNLLEGRSFKPEHIQCALRCEDQKQPSYLGPLLEDIRIYEQAIKKVWTWAQKGPSSLRLDHLQSLHKHLSQHEPKEGARVRTNSPVHRDYQQKICVQTKVHRLLKELFEDVHRFDVNTQDVLNYAAQLHHKLMFIYPYRRQPGNLARLFTNQFLLAHRYPPMILTSHERGIYYEALTAYDEVPLTQLFYRSAWHMIDSLPQEASSSHAQSRAQVI